MLSTIIKAKEDNEVWNEAQFIGGHPEDVNN